jgi:AraC family transcriptional regulator, positive regulator of tynA and feaB
VAISDWKHDYNYVRRRRLERAKDDVLKSSAALSDIAHRWGFSDESHFTRSSFTAAFGNPPSALRRHTN